MIETRFFTTVCEFCGDAIQYLLLKVQDGIKQRCCFYIEVRGEQTDTKHTLLNYYLTLCALKWRNLKKEEGVLLELSRFTQYIKVLFITFKSEGIIYHHERDFNHPSGFHAVLKLMWTDAKVENPKFGTGQHKARIDELADEKLR